ncbi:hypothetical protein Patl1_10031 [Pistacia atlantica]|uniref:Uncharacterized protein n=1 Tax=Pistacia atlantica TaxID=434234 RepID=A0ACC1A7P4_9ROSI|nr:hypothetical protein Patl1_10031 [Pistacia atlantica]
MSGGRFLKHLLLAVLILFLFQQRVADSDVISCRDDEREALLVFKQGLVDKYGLLRSWGSEDEKKNCCEWIGIKCLQTGHVYELLLSDHTNLGLPLEGKINPSLLRLHHLSYLDLSYNNFGGSPIPEFIDSLTKLRHLNLSNAGLKGPIPHRLGNLSRLQLLDLSGNDLEGGNKITGSVPDFARFSSLKDLGLGQNRLNGTISKSIGQMFELRSLDLSDNSLRGVISEEFFLNLSKLDHLDLSHNSFVLNVSDDWVPPFQQITFLSLASCKMGPRFPKWLGNMQGFVLNVYVLDISNAGISDTLPEWVWDMLHHIDYLNISHNYIKGNSIGNMSCLHAIDLSSNNLIGQLSGFFQNLSDGSYTNLSGNKFSGSISFICSSFVGHWKYLDLSNNLLSGMLPDCWIKFEELVVLNLANNGFSGKIPPSIGSLHNIQTLRLSHNKFFGELPNLSNCTQLKILDLQDNALSGKIPEWIGESLPSLLVLSLESNRFNGNIPFQLCRLANIRILDLSLNNISGSIPKCFNNFTALSEERTSQAAISHEFDFDYYDAIYKYIDSAWLTWKGSKHEYKNTLGLVKILDLSINKLDGSVPEEIMSLLGLIGLNLSRNNFSGAITPKIGQLKSLDFLDLSKNRFSGEIPSSLSLIDRLSVMDLSNNNFSGKIPTGTQLQSFNASVYAGNPRLCGLPLPKKCVEEPPQGPATTDIPEDEFITLGFYVSLALGFIVGFWSVCGTLVLSQSWRHAYFNFLADIRDRIYVIATTNFNKLTQRFNN